MRPHETAWKIIKVSAYVGRTSTSFSKRWTTHRADFKKPISTSEHAKYDNEKDASALRRHIERYHPEEDKNFHLCYKVAFVESMGTSDIHIQENKWKDIIKPKINVARMITSNFVA